MDGNFSSGDSHLPQCYWHFGHKSWCSLKEVKSEGVDVMVALDVSKSMEAEDLGASRLAVAKRSIERLIDQLDGDRIGLVVFGGDAYVQCPITTDYGAAKLFLQGVNTGIIPSAGNGCWQGH